MYIAVLIISEHEQSRVDYDPFKGSLGWKVIESPFPKSIGGSITSRSPDVRAKIRNKTRYSTNDRSFQSIELFIGPQSPH